MSNPRSARDSVRVRGVSVGEWLSQGGETGQGAAWPGVSFSEMSTLLKVKTGIDIGRKVVSKEPLSLVDEKSKQGVSNQGD